MPVEEKPPSSERDQTDESLRVERQKTDDALDDRLAAIEATADALIAKARERADRVLATGRAKLDREAAADGTGARHAETVERSRSLADRVLRMERAGEDEARSAERAEHASIFSEERGVTDEDLSRERARSDDAVATRDDFLGIVSHDLRNMLGSVVGFASLIAKAASGREERREEEVLRYAQHIQRSAVRMDRLVGDLLDVASIEAGRFAATREVGDPAQVALEAVEIFQARASASGISLETDVASSSPVAFDAGRILQVLANLLGNAIKFTPRGGKVTVRVERAGDEMRFAVRDTGVGISADHMDAVFERFRQIGAGDRRGVGLGLYISKCIVEGHGGRIWVESGKGEGSTFFFTLPLDAAT